MVVNNICISADNLTPSNVKKKLFLFMPPTFFFFGMPNYEEKAQGLHLQITMLDVYTAIIILYTMSTEKR